MYLREEKENMGMKENEKIKIRFCTQCGSPLQPEDQFCSCCGQRIYTDEESGAVEGKTDQEPVPQEKEDGESDKKAEQKSNENSMREKKSQGGEQEDTGLQQDYDAEEIKKIYGRIKNGQKMREPVFILNFWMVLLLSIVTGGIYLWYAQYRLNKDVDIICRNDGWENPSFLEVVIFSFLTLGIYWFYRQVQRVYEASDGYGVNPGLDGGLSIFLFIFGSFFLGIGPLVVCYFLIKNMERIADQYNKGVVNPNLNQTTRRKMNTIVRVACIIAGILSVGVLIGAIVVLVIAGAFSQIRAEIRGDDTPTAEEIYNKDENDENNVTWRTSAPKEKQEETEKETEKKTKKEPQKIVVDYNVYEDVLESIADDYGEAAAYCQYALYDIDEDGIKELITEVGYSNADWMNYVYSIDEGGEVYFVGEFARSVVLYESEVGSGMYAVWGVQGVEEVTKITKNGTELNEKTLLSKELKPGEDYDTYTRPITEATIDDTSLLIAG